MKPLLLIFRLKMVICLSAICLSFSLYSQENQSLPLFQTDEILTFRLTFDMDSLLSDRGAEPEYRPAHLSMEGEQEDIELDLKIKTRGNFRLNPQNCDFPPIKLNFKKKEIEQNIFSGHDKLKLVTHCQDEAYVLKEYLAYKIYQLLNPHSFQVRLAKITYIDKRKNHRPFARYAFLLESKEALAARLDGEIIEDPAITISEDETLEETTARLYLFQYLLGNRDWDILLKKNVKLVKTTKGEFIPVPYDFDFTGWVNATYTTAYMGDLAKDFEYRAGRKLCKSQAVWDACFAHFESKKGEMIQLITDFKLLGKRERNELIQLVESFYEDIKKPQKAGALFGDCGG